MCLRCRSPLLWPRLWENCSSVFSVTACQAGTNQQTSRALSPSSSETLIWSQKHCLETRQHRPPTLTGTFWFSVQSVGKRNDKENHFCCFTLYFKQNRICQQNITRLSYRGFHSSPLFTQPFSLLPAHLFQHFPTFINFTDFPLRRQGRHNNTWLSHYPFLSFFSFWLVLFMFGLYCFLVLVEAHETQKYSQIRNTYSWTEAGASSRLKTPSLPTVCRRDSARSLYFRFFRALASSYSLLCLQKSTEVFGCIKTRHGFKTSTDGC